MKTKPTSELQRKLRTLKRQIATLPQKAQALQEQTLQALQYTYNRQRQEQLKNIINTTQHILNQLEKQLPHILQPHTKQN